MKPLAEALSDGLQWQDDQLAEIRRAEHDAFLKTFPRDAWPNLPLDRYALGTASNRDSYSYALEWGTAHLGSIRGGTSRKHLIFRRNSGEWAFPSDFANETEAWTAVRSAFVAMFDAADEGRWSDIGEIDLLRGSKMVRLKSLFLYFPDQVLPVYSHAHLRHFATALGLDDGGDPLLVNRRILQHLRSIPALASAQPTDLITVLYGWNSPPDRNLPTYWKIAPGERAAKWPECLANGYICVGWDDVGDLSLFDTEEDFRDAFREAYGDEYNGRQAMISRKANELWRLTQIQPGDKIIANKGISEVVGVGTVGDGGYEWRDDRDEYKHTIAVTWDTTLARVLDPPIKQWGTTTILRAPARIVDRVTGEPEPQPIRSAQPIKDDDVELYERWKRALDRKGQVIFYGPPGTGKTRAARGFARWLIAEACQSGTTPPPNSLMEVTFHASYAYEEFIEGYRPVKGSGSGLVLEMRDGLMKGVAREAARRSPFPYVVLIDEINRANVPRVFGELLTVVELDKRGQEVRLPASGESISIPENLFLLGTMNTADKSIRSLDSALRRRFAFVELMPDPGVLEGGVVDRLDLSVLLTELNARIVGVAGREQQIGHSYFLSRGVPIESTEELADVVRQEIIPLLQEIAFDDYGQLRHFLGSVLVDDQDQRLTDVVNDDTALIDALAREYQAVSSTGSS